MKKVTLRVAMATAISRIKIASVALLAISLVACSERTNSVEYYTEHTNERDRKLQECRSNPGELQHSPNCINAKRSQIQADFSSKNKGMPKGW